MFKIKQEMEDSKDDQGSNEPTPEKDKFSSISKLDDYKIKIENLDIKIEESDIMYLNEDNQFVDVPYTTETDNISEDQSTPDCSTKQIEFVDVSAIPNQNLERNNAFIHTLGLCSVNIKFEETDTDKPTMEKDALYDYINKTSGNNIEVDYPDIKNAELDINGSADITQVVAGKNQQSESRETNNSQLVKNLHVSKQMSKKLNNYENPTDINHENSKTRNLLDKVRCTSKRIPNPEKPKECLICYKKFITSTSLAKHKCTHSNERPCQDPLSEDLTKCDVCKKNFKNPGNLSRHKLIHSSEKPFQCDMCEKEFRRLEHLTRHKNTHSVWKPYKCDMCDMVFTVSTHLARHKFTHTGEKPYKCNVCNMGFTISTHLTRHKLIHTDKKPYSCELCNKECVSPSAVARHKLTHERKRTYSQLKLPVPNSHTKWWT